MSVTASTGKEYTLGRGRLYFGAFSAAAAFDSDGFRYLGNTPSVQMTQAATNLDHFDSDQGIKVKDASVELQRDMTGQFTTDNISVDNLAIWFSGNKTAIDQSAASGITEDFTVKPGLMYQIGVDADNPMGISDLASMTAAAVIAIAATGTLTFNAQPADDDTVTINGVAITFKASGATGNQVNKGGNAAGTAQALKDFINAHPGTLLVSASGSSNVLTLTAVTAGTGGNSITLAKSGTNPALSGATLSGGSNGTSTALTDADWTADPASGTFVINTGGTVAEDTVVTVTYATSAGAGNLVYTQDRPLYGELRYVADNPTETNTDYFWPYVKLTATGNFELKGDTWQQIEFAFEVLKKTGFERAYARRRAS